LISMELKNIDDFQDFQYNLFDDLRRRRPSKVII
jgi:hypothetical protein